MARSRAVVKIDLNVRYLTFRVCKSAGCVLEWTVNSVPVDQRKAPIADFIERCEICDDGFVAESQECRWRLGTVLMAVADGDFVTIRKADAENGRYEFGGMLTLPGGMVRSSDRDDARDLSIAGLAQSSLRNRAENEAGIDIPPTQTVEFAALGPIVSSYTAKGQTRYTLIAAQTTSFEQKFALGSGDHTAGEARWTCDQLDWSRLAPANCTVIAHLCWSKLDDALREVAVPYVKEAVSKCAEWAKDIDLPGPVVPWSSDDELAQWFRAWTLIA